MWNGTFRDWELATTVALIPSEIWDKGAEAVAREIDKIKKDLEDRIERPPNVPKLEQTKLTEHVRRLLESPEMTALAAEGAAITLERAIKTYIDEAPANCLPEPLRHLEALPGLFRSISITVKTKDASEAQARALQQKIEALNAKLAASETALKDARSKTVHGLFTQSALKAAGTAFGAGVVGSVGLALSHFFGQWPDDLTLENLRGFLSDLEKASPMQDEVDQLPPVIDV